MPPSYLLNAVKRILSTRAQKAIELRTGAGTHAAEQRAIDSGHADQAPQAMYSLGLLLDEQRDVVGARAAYWRAIDSGRPLGTVGGKQPEGAARAR